MFWIEQRKKLEQHGINEWGKNEREKADAMVRCDGYKESEKSNSKGKAWKRMWHLLKNQKTEQTSFGRKANWKEGEKSQKDEKTSVVEAARQMVDKMPQCGECSASNEALSRCLMSYPGGLESRNPERSPDHPSLIRPLRRWAGRRVAPGMFVKHIITGMNP